MENNEVYKIVNVVTPGILTTFSPACPTCGTGVIFGNSNRTVCEQCGREVWLVSTDKECYTVMAEEMSTTVSDETKPEKTNETEEVETHEIVDRKELSLSDKVNIGAFFIGVLLILGSPILKERGYYDASGYQCVVGFIDVMVSGAMIWLSNFLENRNQENEVNIQTADNTVETGTAIQKKLG